MKALQAAVVIMGILIVAGVAVIGVTIAKRMGGPATEKAAEGLPAFGDVQVPVPAGARVVWATAAEGRLVIHIQGSGEAARFEVIDLTTGRRLGGVQVGTGAAQ